MLIFLLVNVCLGELFYKRMAHCSDDHVSAAHFMKIVFFRIYAMWLVFVSSAGSNVNLIIVLAKFIAIGIDMVLSAYLETLLVVPLMGAIGVAEMSVRGKKTRGKYKTY